MEIKITLINPKKKFFLIETFKDGNPISDNNSVNAAELAALKWPSVSWWTRAPWKHENEVAIIDGTLPVFLIAAIVRNYFEYFATTAIANPEENNATVVFSFTHYILGEKISF